MSPVPIPTNENREEFMKRCIRFLASEGGRTNDEIIAICSTKWDEDQKEVKELQDSIKRKGEIIEVVSPLVEDKLQPVLSELEILKNKEIPTTNISPILKEVEDLKETIKKKDFRGKDGRDGIDGKDGKDGQDGKSPIKGVDYYTADEELTWFDRLKRFTNEKLQKAKTLITGKYIVEEINKLPDEDANKIDAKHIKNLPIPVQNFYGGGSSSGGDITSVVAGTNLNGGGTSGDVTVNLDDTLTNISAIKFNLTPVVTTDEGTIYWSDDDKTLVVVMENGNLHEVGQNLEIRATNKTGVDIPNGSVVYINGAQGNKPTIALADADTSTTSDSVIGVVTEHIDNNNSGRVTVFGIVKGLDTSSYVTTDILYLSSTAGQFTKTHPTQPAHIVKIGHPVKIDASDGWILVDINTGAHLSELHDVLISGGATGDILQLQSDGLWKNKTVADAVTPTLDSRYSQFLVATKATILATTPTAGRVAYATDTEFLYFADGTNWNESALKMSKESINPDMGYTQDSPHLGYDPQYITDKTLYNVTLRGYNGTPRNGSLRINVNNNPDTFEIYMRDTQWYTIIYDLTMTLGYFAHAPFNVNELIKVWSGDSVGVGLNGIPSVQEYGIDMGAYPAMQILWGGED